MNKRAELALWAVLLAAVLPLTAFASSAPTEYYDGNYDREVTFSLPSAYDGEITEVTEKIRFSTAFSPEETVLRHLLEYPADSEHRSLPGDGVVQLSEDVSFIRSCGTATVNFNSAYADLDAAGRYLLAQCVTNTLCALGRVSSVVILCEGRAVSLSDQEEIPAGAYRQSSSDDLPLVQAQLMARRSEETALRYSADTAIFYPAQAGRGILCETRSVSFPEPGAEAAVQTLLEAMSAPPARLRDIPEMPGLTEYLTDTPALQPLDDDTQAVVLRFSEELNRQMSAHGILRSVLLGAITSTLTSFLPDTSAVICYIGDERIGSLVPVGLYNGANESKVFENGLMRWGDFTHFQLDECLLYFLNDQDKMTESVRALPASWADSPEYLLQALLEGPSYYDSVSDLHAAVPAEAAMNQILGIGTRQNTCMVNLSGEFLANCGDFTPAQERNLVYTLVNTLTNLPWCRRVELYIDGAQPDVLINEIALPGGFMRNADYIAAGG